MSSYERGTVKFFKSGQGNNFGFLTLLSGEEIFFHLTDGGVVWLGLESMSIKTGRRVREPGSGDILLFECSRNKKGLKAAPWCFATDWAMAEKDFVARPMYRLIKQTGEFRLTRDPQTVWEGTNTEDLKQKFPRIKPMLEYKGGISGWEKYWFECKTPEGWRRVKEGFDPREHPLRVGEINKPKMPLLPARQLLIGATKHTWFDEEYDMSGCVWKRRGRTVAKAREMNCGFIVIQETDEYDETIFRSDEAEELIELGFAGKKVAMPD